MNQRLVVTTPEADRDAKRIDQWWTRNRGAAPNLFFEELGRDLALCDHRRGWRISGVLYSHLLQPRGPPGAVRCATD